MKKLFLGLTLLIILLIGSIYGVLFTKAGNNFIASYIENKVNDEQKDVKLKVNDFTLTFNTINFDASINDNSNINIAGDLAIFKKKVDLKYDINIKDLATLENLTKQKLNGPFSTSGKFVGNENLATIEGIFDLAHSESKYNVNLVDFSPKNIKFEIKDAKIEELLNLVNQASYAKGNITIKGDIKNTDLENLDGTIDATLTRGKIVNEIINKEFKQNIQSTINFKSDLNAVLSGDKIKIKSDLITSLADIFAEETVVDVKANKITSDYKIDVKNLTKLEGVIGKKLNGNFLAIGSVLVENNNINITGKSDIFESTTKYDIKLEDSMAKNIKFSVEDAKIDKLLHMLNEPVYTTGDFKIIGDISNNKAGELNGLITTKIENGKVVNEVVNTVFKQNLKNNITFVGDIQTNLSSTQAVSKSLIKTSLANLTLNQTVFDFKESSLDSDYLLSIPNLEKLKDITTAKMRGAIDINGTLKNKSNSLLLTGNSNIIGGKLDFNLKNDDLTASLKDAQIKQLTHMLYYPETFDSKTALDLNYNLIMKKGKLSGNLLNGHFLPNDFSALLNQFAKFDLTREVYETVSINSDINNMVLNTVINMKSKNTTIDVTNSTLDLEKSTIDAKIAAKIKTTEFGVNVNGTTSNPKISVDTKGLLDNQINKQLDKNKDKIEEKLNKVLKGKLGDDGAKDILNNIKSLF
jgi:hypothetical protein